MIGEMFGRLLRDERGTTVMEFGLMITVFMTLMLGLFDLGQMAYTKAILDGAVQSTAREVSLETGNVTAANAHLREMLALSAPGVTVTTSRVNYTDFADIERPETWDDADGSGVCDNNEAYTDENGNGNWDTDVASTGNGGASDVVILTVTASYDPLFPNPFTPGGVSQRSLTSTAVKKNQPFADQAGYGSDAGVCA